MHQPDSVPRVLHPPVPAEAPREAQAAKPRPVANLPLTRPTGGQEAERLEVSGRIIRAGGSSGAFYSNFESKDEVFAAALEYHSREFDRFLEEHPAAGSVPARLTPDGEWLEGLEDWRVLFWLEIVAQGGRSDALKPAVREYFDSARARLTNQMEEGARESGTQLPRPAAELARLVLAAEIGLFVQALFDDEPPGQDSLASVVELVFGGAAG